MRNNHPDVQNAINNGYDFSISDCLSRAWKIVTGNIGLFVVFTFLYFLIVMGLGLIPLLGGLISMVISPALVIGFATGTEVVKAKKHLELNSFFKGFDKWVNLFVGSLLVGLAAAAIIIPFVLIFGLGMYSTFQEGGFANPDASAFAFGGLGMGMLLASILFFFLFLIFLSLFMWVPYVIYFHDYEAVEALKASYAIVKQNIGKHILLMLVGIPIMFAGILAFGIGMLIAIPLLYVLAYEVYCDITQKDDDREMDILDHFTPLEGAE